MSSHKETEIKYKINTNVDLSRFHYDKYLINQFYFDREDEVIRFMVEVSFDQTINWDIVKEVRTRRMHNGNSESKTDAEVKFYLTLKSEGSLVRDEQEIEISKDQYDKFKDTDSLRIEGSIEKIRYKFQFRYHLEKPSKESVKFDLSTSPVYELDIYDTGLQIVEVELEETHDVKEIVSSLYMLFGPNIEDVTDKSQYKNKNLAKKLL